MTTERTMLLSNRFAIGGICETSFRGGRAEYVKMELFSRLGALIDQCGGELAGMSINVERSGDYQHFRISVPCK